MVAEVLEIGNLMVDQVQDHLKKKDHLLVWDHQPPGGGHLMVADVLKKHQEDRQHLRLVAAQQKEKLQLQWTRMNLWI